MIIQVTRSSDGVICYVNTDAIIYMYPVGELAASLVLTGGVFLNVDEPVDTVLTMWTGGEAIPISADLSP